MPSPYVEPTVAFLRSIGIPCREQPGVEGFLPGLRIEDGTLVYDPDVPVSNMLHEAGHLAILPGEYRRRAQSDISGAVRAMLAEVGPRVMDDPDHILGRVMMQASDPEATAWAWAAGEHLGIPPKTLIRDDEYDGDGPFIRKGLQMRSYVGIHGLAHAGFCVTRAGDLERVYGLPAYPKLAMWVQKDVAELEQKTLPRRRMRA